jgi:hypothetical protein
MGESIKEISNLLYYIINKSFGNGIILNTMDMAKVVKSGNRKLVSSFDAK